MESLILRSFTVANTLPKEKEVICACTKYFQVHSLSNYEVLWKFCSTLNFLPPHSDPHQWRPVELCAFVALSPWFQYLTIEMQQRNFTWGASSENWTFKFHSTQISKILLLWRNSLLRMYFFSSPPFLSLRAHKESTNIFHYWNEESRNDISWNILENNFQTTES